MRGQRDKHAAAEAEATGNAVEVIDVSEYQPRRIPSKKWRELIKKVWEVDPLICSHCGAEMKLIALIDEPSVIERILRHLGLWKNPVLVHSGADPPPSTDLVLEPWLSLPAKAERRRRDDPFPDYDTEPVMAYANDPDFAA